MRLAPQNGMKAKGQWAANGWLVLGSPLVVLIGLAMFALLASTPLDVLGRQLQTHGTQQAIGISLRTTALATVAVVVFGTFLALAIHKSKPFFASVLEMLVTVPAIMPPSVAGLALLLAFGRQGLMGPWFESLGLNVAFTPAAVVMAQVFVSSPFFVREASVAFKSLDTSLLEAARLDGAGPARLAWSVTLPLSLPFLLTGVVLSWTRALGEFGATILFAGNLRGVTQTMPLAIYLGFESDLEEAKALAVILLVSAVAVLAIVRIMLGRRMTFAH